ncbi:30S ribosomal protein S8 [Patescibacteria group bacterium]|nr:30S ribosomal protein S8 [Patescibacteria group bacterium]
MVNDPIGDMLVQIKNAVLADRRVITLPYSNMKMAVASVLAKEGYIAAAEKTGVAPKFRLNITLQYHDNTSVITDIKRKSKPGMRIYIAKDKIPHVVGGMGIAILSTSRGVMTGKDAKNLGIGGEFLCEVW